MYLQISPIFLAIVVKHLRYTARGRRLLRTEPQHEEYIFGNNSTGNIRTESYSACGVWNIFDTTSKG
jgi:hypothetical protein